MKRKGAQNPARAAAIANAIRESCIQRGGDPSECDVLAIRTALARTNERPKQ